MTTPKSSYQQPAASKLAAVSRKSPPSGAAMSEQKPRAVIREGTFTKEPSPSVQSVTVEPTTSEVLDSREGSSDLKVKDICLESPMLLPSNISDSVSEQPSTVCNGAIESQKLNLSAVSDESKGTAMANVNISSDYIASLLLGDKGLGSASKLKSSGASRSVGNLMSISSSSRPVSPRSGPTTPVVGRKSVDSQMTEIAAVSKKSARNKISSLWHRDKPSKLDAGKNSTGGERSVADGGMKEKSRDGLGRSPKSFRKSFPLRKSKKAAEKSEPQVAETSRLTRSETFDMLDNDKKSSNDDDILGSPPDGETEMTSSVSNDTSGVIHASVDDVSDSSTHPGGSKGGFRRLGFFKLFAKDSKDKQKAEDKSAELSKSEASETKKKGFSLWRRDHSASKKTKKQKSDGEWTGQSGGVVKSATLPSDVSSKVSQSRESLSPPRVPCSATTEALVSTASSRRVSDTSATSEPTSNSDDVEPSTIQGPSSVSGGSRTETPSADSSPARRQQNCTTSIVTTV